MAPTTDGLQTSTAWIQKSTDVVEEAGLLKFSDRETFTGQEKPGLRDGRHEGAGSGSS